MRTILLTSAMTLVMGAAATPAAARSPDAAEYQRALAILEADPTDASASFSFAEAGVRHDPAAAAAVLEVLAARSPDQPALAVDLATLHLALARPGLARTALTRVLAIPNLPELLRQRAESLLLRVDAVNNGAAHAGTITLSGRYDTNASPAPAPPMARLPGRTDDLEDLFIGRDDYAGVATGTLQALWSLGPATTMEVNLLGHGTRRLHEEQVNLNLLSADAGPRWQLTSGPSAWSARPFLSTAYVEVDEGTYLRTLGVGLNVRAWLGASLLADASTEFLKRDFNSTEARPEADLRSGPLWLVQGGLRWQITASTLAFAHAAFLASRADEETHDYRRTMLALGVSQSYDAPFRLTPRPWNTSLTLDLSRTLYGAADPKLDRGGSRRDTRQDLTLTTRIPITADVALMVTGLRSWTRSTEDAFDHTNTAATLGIAWRF
ncbi:MAG TPA: surface lipoprotein assembly modifier [Azospirillaceae bacterium]|nr:surface lipoprotein assembly modifier [Azospirillaceae bacterium]